jgi:hypothetical protein
VLGDDYRERIVDMRRAENSTIDLGVFGISVVITVLFLLWGVLVRK